MHMYRISCFFLAVAVFLSCFFAPPCSAGVPKSELEEMNPEQAKQHKQELREAIDKERTKILEPSSKPAKPQKPLEIIIHGD